MADQWATTDEHAPAANTGGWASTDEEPKSVGGFVSNVLSSGKQFASDVAAPILHPQRTLEGVTGLLEGMAEKGGAAPVNGVSHQGNVDALVNHYKDRYGSWDGFSKALYTDPVGVAADIGTLASGVGAAGKGVELAADAAKLGKVADVAGTVAKAGDAASSVTDPLRVATRAAAPVARVADKVMDAGADTLARSSLKGGFTVATPAADVTDAVAALRDNRLAVSPGGAKKISDALNDIRQQVQDRVSTATRQGVTIDPAQVKLRLDDVGRRYWGQVNPDQDLRDIDKVGQNFMANNPGPIPAAEAQAMKVGSNSLNADKYGKVSTAQVEAEKGLTRGLKEELETQIPELAGLNAKQAKLMNLDDILGKAVNKYVNSGGFSGNLLKNAFSKTGLEIGGATGLLTHDAAYGASAAALQAVLSDPIVKSRLVTIIDMVRQANPARWGTPRMGTGLSRIEQLATGLSRIKQEPQ